MPGLFSRRPKVKGPTQLGLGKGYLAAISSADIDRLGLSSPTPSTADANLLPRVPTKNDLPILPPKEPTADTTSRPSQPPLSPLSTNMNEFGQLHAQPAAMPSTIASTSFPTEKPYLQSPTPHTLSGVPRSSLTSSLRPISSRSQLGRQQSSSPSVHDTSFSSNVSSALKPAYTYGYTAEGWHIQLESARVSALLEACGEQIRSRGLDNPLIFSSMALDLSPANVASLIKLFSTTHAGQRTLPQAFLDEIRYANPHDLAAVIKWAFARMGRVLAVPVPIPGAKKGEVREEMIYVQQRGFFDLEAYNAWREQERRQHYPATAFKDFLAHLQPENARLLTLLFSLLSSTASYSLKNGMMPAKLSKHFGPLLFGLPEDETFARTYDAYVRVSNATEHLLLSYIRYQATTTTLPPRLAQHITGYPSILAAEITFPSPSSKLVPITQIERTVRLYSPDLVQSACEMDLTEPCPEWQDCRDSNEILGKDPQLSDKFRKLINLRGGATQGRRSGVARTRDIASGEDDAVAAHSSLVSKQWDDFLSGGFSTPDSSKLAFDLNETRRKTRLAKRETVQWNDFFKDGFHSGDSETLADVLSFDDVLKQDVQNWALERDQLHAKLKSRQDKLPAFNYDTSPRLVSSPTLAGAPEGKLDNHPISRMDETFADVWADYLLGSGWSNRDELTHRNANFVVVQYKSRPNASTVGSQSAGSSLSAPTRFQVSARKDESVPKDERVDAAWFVIQEVVPAQYRADLEASGRGTSKGKAMIRKLTMFRSRKEKERSNGSSNNGNAHDRSVDSADDVFRPGPGGSTKRILLSDQLQRNGSTNASHSSLRSLNHTTNIGKERVTRGEEDASDAGSANGHAQGHAQFRSEGHLTGSKLISTLRAKSIRVAKSARRGASSPALKSHADEFGAQHSSQSRMQQGDMLVDRSFTSADFETRSVATDADDAASIASSLGGAKRKPSQFRSREGAKRPTGGRDDAWIDIMVRANGNRMSGQDSLPARKESLGLPGASAHVDDTAQLSVAELETGASTPRTPQHNALGGSDERFESAYHLRSSTPPLTASTKSTPETNLGLDRIESRSSAGGGGESLADDTPIRVSDHSMADASLTSHGSSLTPAAAVALDPVAAARAALKSRKEMPPRVPSQIDTKKLVESLRAGLSPIEAVRASKEANVGASSPGSPSTKLQVNSGITTDDSRGLYASSNSGVKPVGYRDPFAKDPVAGRVADVASRFGGRTGTTSSTMPVLKSKASHPDPDPDSEKPLPAVEPKLNPILPGTTQRCSIDSTGDDDIYPEDAASNFDPRDTQPELQAQAQSEIEHLSLPHPHPHPHSHSHPWSTYDTEPQPQTPIRFTQPYQPGMPLDNVLEESESVISTTTNL